MPETRPPEGQDDRVPLFGTWRAIHAAVALCAALVMALLALFSRWPF
jgi:anti-sigma-K factor RskA